MFEAKKIRRYENSRLVTDWSSVAEVGTAISGLYTDMFLTMKIHNMVIDTSTIKLTFHDMRDSIGKVEIRLNAVMKATSARSYYPEAIYKNGPNTTVKWEDGSVTTVKLAEGEQDSEYGAFTAAIAIKAIGANSRIKKLLKQKTVLQKRKEKKHDEH